MTQLIYEPIPEYDWDTAIRELESGIKERITLALLSLAFHGSGSDWLYVQTLCLKYAKSEDQNIRRTAILCFGYLGRFQTLQTDIVLPVVIEALQDSSDFVRGCADETL